MNTAMINASATVLGLVGMVACLGAGILRLSGQYYLAGIPVSTMFLGAIGLIVSGCFIKLHLIVGQISESRSRL